MNKKFKNDKVDEVIEKLSTENKFLLKIDDQKERIYINKNEDNRNIRNDLGFSQSLMKSSIMENKIISGLNINADDYTNLSTNLMSKISNTFNKNLSSNYLSKENKNKLIKMNEIMPFNNTTQYSPIQLSNNNSNINNLITNKISNEN